MSTQGNVVKLPRRTARKPAERRAQPVEIDIFPLNRAVNRFVIERDILRLAAMNHGASIEKTCSYVVGNYIKLGVSPDVIRVELDRLRAYMLDKTNNIRRYAGFAEVKEAQKKA